MENIINNYRFLLLSQDEIDLFVNNEIKNNDKNIERKIEAYLDSIVIDRLNNDKKCYGLINSYIKYNIKNINDYEEAVLFLKKLGFFFRKYDFMLDPDLAFKLIDKNKHLSNAYSQILINASDNNDIYKLISDDNLILLFEMYCTLNNIDLENLYNRDNLIPYIDYAEFENIDSIKLYFKEMGSFPLCGKEQEKKYFNEINNGNIKAKREFIERNLRLVVNVAKKYKNRGIPLLDLIQEGNIGLMIAVDKYDVTKKYRFSTYATWWIKQCIIREIAKSSKNIRLPEYMFYKVSNFIKTYALLEQEFKRAPKIEEIAERMNISIEQANNLYLLQSDTVSFNTYIDNEEEIEFIEIIESFDPSNEEIILTKSMQEHIRKVLMESNLLQREKEILMLRYGIYDGVRWKLEEIGKLYNLTHERIRQIEDNALKKLRRSNNIKELYIYMEDPKLAELSLNILRRKDYLKKTKGKL